MSDGKDISRREWLRGRWLREEPAEADVSRSPAPGQPVMRYPQGTSNLDAGGASLGSGASPIQSRRRTIPVFRPPGAVAEAQFLAGCTRCEKCIEVCPHDAILQAPSRLREAAGTPILDPDRQPCLMCEGTPCIDACEPGVLSRQIPIAMGTARITEQTCLAHQGTLCTVCSEQCPVEGAIELSGTKPHVDESRCVGCGVCRFVCPAPENAVLLMPQFARPALPPKAQP